MNTTGFPSPNEGTAEDKQNNNASGASLSQLKQMLDDVKSEVDRTAEREYPVFFASERFPNGIPSASQLKSFLAQEKKNKRGGGTTPSEPSDKTNSRVTEQPQTAQAEPTENKEELSAAEDKMFAILSMMTNITDELAAVQRGLTSSDERIKSDTIPAEGAEQYAAPVGNMAAEYEAYPKTQEYPPAPDTAEKLYNETERFAPGSEDKAKKRKRVRKRRIKRSARSKRRERSKKRRELSLEQFTGSILDNLPTAEQIQNSKPRHGRTSDLYLKGMPTEKQLIHERRRLNYRGDFFRVIRNTLSTLITVSAIAVLVAVLLLPVLRIYGASMTPALNEGEIVISVKGGNFSTGDIVAFYYNNKILVKRVIAQAGDWVNIDTDGTVSINGEQIEEPYVQEKAFGECDIELPYQVPEDRVFVMGDYRDVSIDSRSTAIGPIAKDQVVGRIIYRIWPLETFGKIE